MNTVLHMPPRGPAPNLDYLAICIPCLDKPNMLFSQDLAVMMYRLGVQRFPTLMIHESGSFIPKVRNRLVENVRRISKEAGVTIGWYLFLDADMRFPADTPQRLMAHNKDIIGCTYVRRSAPFDCLGRTLTNKPVEAKDLDLLEMAGLPTGVLMIKSHVFHSLKRPYFFGPYREESAPGANDQFEWGEDYGFCIKAREAGFQIWLDPQLSKSIGHVSEKTLYPETDSWPDVAATA